MSIRAVVEKDIIRLPPGVHFPDGTHVMIKIEPEPETVLNLPTPDSLGDLTALAEPMGTLTNEKIDRIIYEGR